MSGESHEHGADAMPCSVSTGKGMSVRELLAAARKWAKRQIGVQKSFGWTTLKKRRAQMRSAVRKAKAAASPPSSPPAGARKLEPIEFQSARQHVPETGVRKFRVADNDPWRNL